ncbi:MAG: hypothetical protein K2P94_07775 [Rhodospirillaceae bacterium]|nr:hypothetical protein [Rhodospirillaceae bacterium]
MKLAFLSAGLFLLSYLLVNGGLGPRPFLIVVPLLVAVGSAVAARWLMRRGRGAQTAKAQAFDPDSLPMPPQPRSAPPPAPPRSGGKARKLF